jgi:hypothetical protein
MGRGAGIGRRLLLAVATLALAACADLGGVRDFALLSTSITGSSDMSARWRDTESRLKAIPLPGDFPLDISTGDRGPIHQETEKMLAAVTAYMDAMGQLAADKLPSVDSQVTGLKNALNALPGPPITPQRVEAVGILGNLLSLPLDAYRQAKVRKLIEQADKPLQNIVTGLIELAGIYRSDLANERNLVRDWAALQTSGTGGTPADFLSRRFVTDLARKYDAIDQGIVAYIKALELIADRHDRLVNGLASSETIARTLLQLSDSRLKLIDARDKIRVALAQKV